MEGEGGRMLQKENDKNPPGVDDVKAKRPDEYVFGIFISACKKQHLQRHWLLPEHLTIQEWMNIVNEIYVMEMIFQENC